MLFLDFSYSKIGDSNDIVFIEVKKLNYNAKAFNFIF